MLLSAAFPFEELRARPSGVPVREELRAPRPKGVPVSKGTHFEAF